MSPKFLADENLNAKIVAGLVRREPSIDFQTAKQAEILGLPDDEVLAIAAQSGRILVTHVGKPCLDISVVLLRIPKAQAFSLFRRR
jgi:predicted nuclease of predicted toxin-antitoxin system